MVRLPMQIALHSFRLTIFVIVIVITIIIRQLTGGLPENGADYKWVSYRDYIYGNEVCEPVKFDETLPYIPCYLTSARLKSCKNGWQNRNILGYCNENDGSSMATTCREDFQQEEGFTNTNAQVLCMSKVTRRELIITQVGVLTSANVATKPWMVLKGNLLYRQLNPRTTKLFKQINRRGGRGVICTPHIFSKWWHIKDQVLACKQLWVS